MFDAGLVEMLLVAVVALLVVGPERLPGIARKAGYWVGKARRFIANARTEMEGEFRSSEMRDMLNKQESEIQELRSILTDAKTSIEDPLKELREKTNIEQDLADPVRALSQGELEAKPSDQSDKPASS